MSVESDAVPFPDSPIDDYFQRRYRPFRDWSPTSSTLASPIDEEKAMMKLEALAAEQGLDEGSNDEFDGLLETKEQITSSTPLEYTVYANPMDKER